MPEFTLIKNLDDLIADITPESIISRTIHNDENLKVILFGFAEGQELSEHTASSPAIIHIIYGKVDISLENDSNTGNSGTWIHMPAELKHSIFAHSESLMLLYLLKNK